MKILSVDDKVENLCLLEALFRGHGHTIESAHNGHDALRLAAENSYDAIISDILMPRMDGFQLCREIRADPRLHHLPFVFYTATYTDTQDVAFGLSLGADRYLIKPTDIGELVSQVQRVAETKRPASEPVPVPVEEDTAFLKEYNSRLVSKLEKKMLDLETANAALQADIRQRERAEAERAKLEAQLRQAQKMDAIGNLAGGIAHDFNNILTGIIGFTELAKTEPGNPVRTLDSLDGVISACNRAKELVRQILSFSRRQEQKRAPILLHTALDDALKLLRAVLPTTVEIRTQCDPSTPTVLADATQIHQLITNLVTNAWHAIGDRSGLIEIAVAPFPVSAELARTHADLRDGRYVRVCVSDNGSGMDAATLDHIFDPFFTTKELGKGSGLGLSVVHGIMKSSDGAVTVASTPGEGSTFALYFPALDVESAAPTAPATVTPESRGERILVVDDEPVLTTLAYRCLTRLGYRVTTRNDPAAALTLFRDEMFDLVITDLAMPHITGLELSRQMLHLRPGTKIMLMTGFSATMDATAARENGFREMLLKPYNIQELSSTVRRVLDEA